MYAKHNNSNSCDSLDMLFTMSIIGNILTLKKEKKGINKLYDFQYFFIKPYAVGIYLNHRGLTTHIFHFKSIDKFTLCTIPIACCTWFSNEPPNVKTCRLHMQNSKAQICCFDQCFCRSLLKNA